MGFGDKAIVLLDQLSDSWFNPDRIADIVDSIKRLRTGIVRIAGLPTEDDLEKVENLIARSQTRVQRLQASIAKLEAIVSEVRGAQKAAATKARRTTPTRAAARRKRAPKIGKKPPSTLLDIDLKKRR